MLSMSVGSLTVPNVLVEMKTLPVEKKVGSNCSPAMNSKGEEDSSKLEEPKASKTPEYRSKVLPLHVFNSSRFIDCS